MANVLSPFGFLPIRHVSALGHTTNEYPIASGLAETITQGDLVKSDGAGGIQLVSAATDIPLGVFLGYRIDDKGKQGPLDASIPFQKQFVAGSVVQPGQTFQALVHDDPFETLKVQSSGTINAADVGKLVDFVAGTPTVFQRSGSTVGSVGGVMFRVERILEEPMRGADANNNTTGFGLTEPGLYATVEVKFNKHARGGPATA